MSGETKHTEGPWHVERDDHFGPGYVIVSPAAGMHNRAPVVRLSSPLMEMDETLEADAYLIAASPDMLAALHIAQAALAMMIEPNSISKTTLPIAFAQATEAEAKARTAIAKAVTP